MPIFEYRCPTCGYDFELFVRRHEQPVCPRCTEHRVERILSVTAAHTGESRGSPLPVAGGGCMSSGPPCGPACSRWPAE